MVFPSDGNLKMCSKNIDIYMKYEGVALKKLNYAATITKKRKHIVGGGGGILISSDDDDDAQREKENT